MAIKIDPRAFGGLLLALVLVGGLVFFAGNTFMHNQTLPHAQDSSTTQVSTQDNKPIRTTTSTTTTTNTHEYPTYLPGKGLLVFSDSIQTASSWEQDANQQQTGFCQMSGGAYHATMGDVGYRWCTDNGGSVLNSSDFAYQIQMKILKGDCGGILFRANPNVAYAFTICQWGEHLLYKYSSTSTQAQLLAGGKTATIIHPGFNQTNQLTVVVQKTSIILFINGQKIDQLQDKESIYGNIGVTAIDENNPTDVIFSNAIVWAL